MKIKVHNPNKLPTIPYSKLEDFQGDLKSIITEEALDKLKKSILKHGVFVPKFVYRENGQYLTLDGHQTKKALISLKIDGYEIPRIPIVEIKAKDRKDAAEKLLQINSRYAEINPETTFFDDFELDMDILNDIEIPELDADILFNTENNEGLTDDDAIPEEVEPICKSGDLWQLGRHRLLCGDCTIKENVEKLFTEYEYDPEI